MVIRVGKLAPDVTADAYVRNDPQPRQIRLAELRGQWVVLFFYPRDFTFVCPTEIVSFARLYAEFTSEEAVVIGASTDSYFAHKAWYETDARLAGVTYPVLADTSLAVSRAFDVLLEDGTALRGTFIIDPDGILRHIQVNDLDVGRNVDETLRLLRALKTGELCPAAWTPGEPTLNTSIEADRPEHMPAVVRVTDDTIDEVLSAERAALIVTRSDCGSCAAYQQEIERLVGAGELTDIAIGKIVLDERGAIGFKRANPWLPSVESLPYTVLYQRGRQVDRFAASKGAYLRERVATSLNAESSNLGLN